jgi:hypothetical protein
LFIYTRQVAKRVELLAPIVWDFQLVEEIPEFIVNVLVAEPETNTFGSIERITEYKLTPVGHGYGNPIVSVAWGVLGVILPGVTVEERFMATETIGLP